MSAQQPPTYAPGTIAVSGGRPERRPGAPVNEPVWLTSTYIADGEYSYARAGNPTWDAFEATLGSLEGGQALVFASGLAAIAAAMSLVPAGGVVVLPRSAYGGTGAQLRLAEELGRLRLREVDVANTQQVAQALPGADLLLLETPSNPLLEIADLPALTELAHANGAIVAADNTFATPIVQRPLDHGADVVVHSVTKYLAGHSDVVLGAAVTRVGEAGDALHKRLWTYRYLNGAIAGPQEVWLALRGLRTLALRMERSQSNASELARRLVQHPAISRVRHPSLPEDPGHARATALMRGYGAILSLEVGGDPVLAERITAGTRLWVNTTSLGGVESSLERRRRHPLEPDSVPNDLIRLSVGIEDVEDLWADLQRAIETLT